MRKPLPAGTVGAIADRCFSNFFTRCMQQFYLTAGAGPEEQAGQTNRSRPPPTAESKGRRRKGRKKKSNPPGTQTEQDELMFWTSESQSPPPPEPTLEERIPIIARRRSSGEVEVLGWCSRARPTSTSTSSPRPPHSPVSLSHVTEDGELELRRNLSLPWTNHRLLPEYPVLTSPSWSTTSSSSSESSSDDESVDGDIGDFGTFTNDGDGDSDPDSDDTPLLPAEPPVTWLSLPHKSQLLVLALCRLSEPLTQTSASSYLYYYLSSFHPPGSPPPSPATISRQAGLLASSFALAQVLTGILWGRLSDRIGRKPCILLGLAGTTISAIGFGFSSNLAMALSFRILGGLLNGNVGVLRTMVTEVVREKKYQSRAFLILPMCFNIGIIIGPALGGLLAEPATTWPDIFGNTWLQRYPYALPNLLSAAFLATSWLLGFLFLRETLSSRRNNRDIGLELSTAALSRFNRLLNPTPLPPPPPDTKHEYSIPLPADEESTLPPSSPPRSFRDIFTPNIIFTLISFALLPLHNVTFMHLWTIFLSTPRGASSGPFTFTGGLGLPARTVGAVMSYLGLVGIVLQLLVYPPLQARLGLLRSYKAACMIFPVVYFCTPFLVRLPEGVGLWIGVGAVLMLQIMARTGAQPGSVMLLTNAVEDRAVLGSVNGVGVSMAGLSRAVGPVVGGLVYAVGLEAGVVGVVFWGMAGVAGVGVGSAWWVKEGRGIEEEGERAKLLGRE